MIGLSVFLLILITFDVIKSIYGNVNGRQKSWWKFVLGSSLRSIEKAWTLKPTRDKDAIHVGHVVYACLIAN